MTLLEVCGDTTTVRGVCAGTEDDGLGADEDEGLMTMRMASGQWRWCCKEKSKLVEASSDNEDGIEVDGDMHCWV